MARQKDKKTSLSTCIYNMYVYICTCIHVATGATESPLYTVHRISWVGTWKEARGPLYVIIDISQCICVSLDIVWFTFSKYMYILFTYPKQIPSIHLYKSPCTLFWPGSDIGAMFPYKPSVCWPSVCALARALAKITQFFYPPFS